MRDQYKELYRKFGLNVVYYRKVLRATQLQLAEMLDIERSHISAIELGNVGVSMDLIFKMCEVFEIKPKELFDFEPKPDVFFDKPDLSRDDIMTDNQLGTIMEMIGMILDGCKDLDEAKDKVHRLAEGLKTP